MIYFLEVKEYKAVGSALVPSHSEKSVDYAKLQLSLKVQMFALGGVIRAHAIATWISL